MPGPAGAPGAAGPAGPKGATGDAGTAPPPSFDTAGSFGNVAVAANDVGTGTVLCPKGLRALSGGPSGLTIGSPPRLTVISSEPNDAGTGWIVTMKAGTVASNFQVEVVCAAVN